MSLGGSGFDELRIARVLVRHFEKPYAHPRIGNLVGKSLCLVSLIAVVLDLRHLALEFENRPRTASWIVESRVQRRSRLFPGIFAEGENGFVLSRVCFVPQSGRNMFTQSRTPRSSSPSLRGPYSAGLLLMLRAGSKAAASNRRLTPPPSPAAGRCRRFPEISRS